MYDIYLDNNATTKVAPEVLKAILPFFVEHYGNAGSAHRIGMVSDRLLYESRNNIKRVLQASAHNVIFTSGGTESDNLAILGVAHALRDKGNHIIGTSVEHPAVLECLHKLEDENFEVTYVSPREDGIVHAEDILREMRDTTILVSVMHVNNETGAIFPIEEIAEKVKEKNPECIVHSDGVQAIGKVVPDLGKIDLYAMSGHKFHAPKGIGALIVREGTRLLPIQYGGGQERGYRPGTENVPGIVGLTCALELAYQGFDEKITHYKNIREALLSGLKGIQDMYINSPGSSTPQTVNVSFIGVPGEALQSALSEQGVCVGTGSACKNKNKLVTRTLTAFGFSEERANSSIRFSFSGYTTHDEIKKTAEILKDLIPKLRNASL